MKRWPFLLLALPTTATADDGNYRPYLIRGRAGGSLSLAIRGEHTETSLNLNATYGSGETLIPDDLDFTVLKATSDTQIGLYAVVASSFQF